jgi:hypothetical protein
MTIDLDQNNIKLAYKGPFYIDIISDLGGYLRRMYKLKPLTSNRLYKIFFELTQNVAKYSAEECHLYEFYKYGGIGSFTIEEINDTVKVSTSNLVRKEDTEVLAKYCREINSMSHEKLRDYKAMKRRTQPDILDKGAYIGIIQIGIITKNKIEFEFEPISEGYARFTITAQIDIE